VLLLALAPTAGAAAPRSGRYAGKTSQKLPFALYLGLAHAGEIGRPVIYTGIEGNLHARLRELATVQVRVVCTSVGGTRWSEVIPVRVLGSRRNHQYLGSGSYTVTRGRFRYSPVDLVPRRLESYHERLRGRVAAGKASGTVELEVKKTAEEPLVAGETPFASCGSGRVKWKARLARRSRGGGEQRVGPAPPPTPRRLRLDSYLAELLDGRRAGGGGGAAVFQKQGGGSFTAYVFKPGGDLLYCRRTPDGSRDYRSGKWTVLAGYLWSWPSDDVGHAEGQVRLSFPGSVVDADVGAIGSAASVSAKSGGLGSVAGDWQANVAGCESLESAI
jgi:hypothetical protein